ncbi:MAG: VIT domain-containing protein [Planctomycetota bacterium]
MRKGFVVAGCAFAAAVACALTLGSCMKGRGVLVPEALHWGSAIDGCADRGLFGPPGAEVWILSQTPGPDAPARAATRAAEADRADLPRGGELRARLPGAAETVVLPLKHTDVKGQVTIYVASVRVRQEYHNPYSEKIEAIYVFPLPHDAAVRDFLMKVGERTIRGIVREREEAQRLYLEARRQGYVASLLTEERPNIFAQSVANIEPGRSIDIEIAYFHTLTFSEGVYEFVFPMTVGPRYNPAGDRDGVGAVAYGARGSSRQRTEIEYLRPPTVGSHDVSLEIEIDAGSPIRSIESPSHEILIERPEEDRTVVRLNPLDSIPNRDFVLRYRVDGRDIAAALAVHKAESGSYFALAVHPPLDLDEIPAPPREMVFVLDSSGSMDGEPIARAKGVVAGCLERLRPADSFHLIRFASDASTFSAGPLPATRENVREALAWVENASAGGGTEMLKAIRAALDFPRDPRRFRVVAIFTDGYIGNDRELIGEVERSLGPARVFAFGVGTSVNRFLLEGLARAGRGAVAYAGLSRDRSEDLRELEAFFRRIEHPVMTDLRIELEGGGEAEAYPSRIPDLFAGRPVWVVGRLEKGALPSTVRILGRVGGEPREIAISARPGATFDHDALPCVWARAKIAELYARVFASAHGFEVEPEIKRVALEHGLVSAYTAFVAVDSLTRTAGDHGTTISVPANMPAGVRYETTVCER